jgi:hypothetical protein
MVLPNTNFTNTRKHLTWRTLESDTISTMVFKKSRLKLVFSNMMMRSISVALTKVSSMRSEVPRFSRDVLLI